MKNAAIRLGLVLGLALTACTPAGTYIRGADLDRWARVSGQAIAYREPVDDCDLGVLPLEWAERRPGGALYKGPLPKTMMQAMSMPEMKGAHAIHASHFGGDLIMAADLIHHLEVIPTRQCGLQVVFYNAFIEPVSAKRFRATVRLIPEDGEGFVGSHELSHAADGTYMQTPIDHDMDKILGGELHVRYPEGGAVEIYAIYLGDTSRYWSCYDHHADVDWPVCIELLPGIAKAFRKRQSGGRRASIPSGTSDEALSKVVLEKVATGPPPAPNLDAYRTLVVTLGALYPCEKMDMSKN